MVSMEIVDSDEVAEDVPNDRSGLVDSSVSSLSGDCSPQVVTVDIPQTVLVAAQNLFNDHDSLKTTRIIIHDPSLDDQRATIVQAAAFNHLNRSLSLPERNYTWDPSVHDAVLPVRCRNIRGELHKNRFGSGNRGRSILTGETWYTPSEFESLCGRGNSKDWKRSIRYAGRTLQCLIEEGILRPHATSCTCSACCDNNLVVGNTDTTNGPIRLFTPYKRRKRQIKRKPNLKVSTNMQIDNNSGLLSASLDDEKSPDVQVDPISTELLETPMVPLIHRELGAICPESVIVTPAATPQTPKSAPTAMDFNEQRQWWQLEEMVKNTIRQAVELQKQFDTVKNQCAIAKETALQQLRIQMENEKKEALKTCQVEAQMNLSRAILEAKADKEQALQQAHIEMQEKLQAVVSDKGEPTKKCANCDREAFSECTGCHRVSYCSTFCQRKDWKQHREECGDSVLSIDDCNDELNEDCEVITS